MSGDDVLAMQLRQARFLMEHFALRPSSALTIRLYRGPVLSPGYVQVTDAVMKDGALWFEGRATNDWHFIEGMALAQLTAAGHEVILNASEWPEAIRAGQYVRVQFLFGRA